MHLSEYSKLERIVHASTLDLEVALLNELMKPPYNSHYSQMIDVRVNLIVGTKTTFVISSDNSGSLWGQHFLAKCWEPQGFPDRWLNQDHNLHVLELVIETRLGHKTWLRLFENLMRHTHDTTYSDLISIWTCGHGHSCNLFTILVTNLLNLHAQGDLTANSSSFIY